MIYIIIILSIVLLEAVIKNHMDKKLAFGEVHSLFKGKILLNKHYNKGMMLNFLEKNVKFVKKLTTILLAFILVVFACFLPKKGNHLLKLGLSLSLGGAISNVYDRIQKGHVVDYFSFNCKRFKKINSLVFNLADIFIFLGSLLLFLASLFRGKSVSGFDKALK